MFFRRLSLAFLLIILFLSSKTIFAESSQKTLDLIIQGIEHNYEQIRTGSMTITHIVKTPDGQSQSVYEKLTFKGNNYYCESYDTENQLSSTQVLHGDKLWRFLPNTSDPWFDITLSDEVTQMVSHDPRQFMASSLKSRFTEELLQYDISNVTTETVNGIPIIRVAFDSKYNEGPSVQKILKRSIEFDSSKNMLPVKKTLIWDGMLGDVTEIKYQECIPGKAWFPLEQTYSTFPPQTPAQDAINKKANLVSTSVISDLKTNVSVKDSLFIPPEIASLPDGTQVRDKITGQSYQKYTHRDPTATKRKVIIIAINIIAIIAIVYVWRRNRKQAT